MTALAAIPAGYLLGLLSGARIVGHAVHTDFTFIGTRNPGASNVAMTAGKKWGAVTCAFDIGKCVAAGALFAGTGLACAAAAAAVFGHCWPVWHRFRGGKGYACYVGLMAVIDWRMALCVLVTGLLLAVLADTMMGMTLSSAVLAPPAACALCGVFPACCALAASIAIFVRHQDNIGRLRRGEEPSFRATLAGKYLGGLK